MRAVIMSVLALAACTDRESVVGRSALGPRIVSLHDVMTEIVVALEVTDHLVGIGELVDATPEVQRSVARIPRVAGLESIVALRPDVVLGLDVVAERDPDLVKRLRERGVDVYLADPATIDDVYAATRAVAARAGAVAAGERVVADLRARVERDSTTAPSRRARVFVYDCCDPPFTAGGKSVLTDVIERAGGHNVFADLATDWTNVSWEAAVALRPELVVIHRYKYEGQSDVAEKRSMLASIPSLADLPTVVLPLGWSLGGLRSVDGLEKLRQVLR